MCSGHAAKAWISCALLLFLTACVTHLEFPPLGDPLPASAKLEISPSIKELTIHYSDSCGQLQEAQLGDRLQEALREGIHRTFQKTFDEETDNASAPDYVIQVELVDSSFDLNKEGLYDRAPAVLRVNAIARIHDRAGALLRQTDIQFARQDRLRLEQLSKNCNYMIEPFIHDTAIDFATRVSLTARQTVAGSQKPAASREPNQTPMGSLGAPSVSAADLRFKATLLDENSDLIFDGGEHVRIRVDVVNTGPNVVENASASLTGTQTAIERFPTTVLRIPPLQPGQTQSLEFVATLPLLAQPQRAEIRVSVEERGGNSATPQTLSFMITPTGSGGDNVDQVPAQASGVRRPEISVITIGVSSYLDQQIQTRKYASRDAETVAKCFQTLGGVPSSNISLLTDRKATHAQIQKALLEWLPTRSMKGGIVIVYFSGQAMVTAAGEILLVPYDGMKTATTLYPLKSLESALAKLNPQQAILIFEGKISSLHDHLKTPAIPRWDLQGGGTIRLIPVEGLGRGLDDDGHRHGLLTYYLLRGLRGEADTNRDGNVTLGEIGGFVRQKVAWASKSQFGSVQHPQIIPLLKPDDKAADVVLTTLPSIAASETP